MRVGAMRRWRGCATLAVVAGFLFGIGLAAYALYGEMLDGLAWAGCEGGGCEDKLNGYYAHDQRLLVVAACVGGSLIVVGTIAAIVLGKRLRRGVPPELPVATARQLRD